VQWLRSDAVSREEGGDVMVDVLAKVVRLLAMIAAIIFLVIAVHQRGFEGIDLDLEHTYEHPQKPERAPGDER
jgi:hypothetical protein